MKAVFFFFALVSGVSWAAVHGRSQDDRTITKVVKMLEAMLEKSKSDGDLDRKLYAKFLCYCNTKKEVKTKEIADLTEVISSLEDTIAELRGENAALSTECAELKKAIEENELQQAKATKIREDENAAYLSLKEDLEGAIDQTNLAVEALGEVGADQTLSTGADHKQFMAKAKIKNGEVVTLQTKARIRDAVSGAMSFMGAAQRPVVEAFLQAPFTGTYTAQSGEVVGILKQMRDTFEKNLAEATAAEEAAVKAYEKLMEALKKAHEEMTTLKAEKQAKLAENDEGLSTARSNLEDAQKEKAIREDFLAVLIPMCSKKAEEYEERQTLRANEDAAISEAIALLNKDAAFEAFGKVEATKSGALSFMQTVQRHDHGADVRAQVMQLLEKAVRSQKSMRLVKILALVEGGNPFTKVLEAIEKLVALLDEEGKADKENLEWCDSERTVSDQTIEELDAEIASLMSAISDLTEEIEAPETGLKARIEATEVSLQENYHAQETQTEQRTAENQAYQANIADIVEAERLLTAAINVLTKYYSQISTEGETTTEKPVMPGDNDEVPELHEDAGHLGQSSEGNKVIEMLTFIQENTHKEETAAHSAERDAQHAFEDSMAQLKEEEAGLQESLAELKETLAQKEKELFEKQEELKAAEEELASVKAYLLSIKPGCDFITENIKYRDGRRTSEKEALEEAEKLIKDTPHYKQAVSEAHLESLGGCRDTCVEHGEENVICKACLAKVTVPGYCAGHPGTEGCD